MPRREKKARFSFLINVDMHAKKASKWNSSSFLEAVDDMHCTVTYFIPFFVTICDKLSHKSSSTVLLLQCLWFSFTISAYLSTDLDAVVLEKTKLYILLNHETEVYCKKPNGLPEPTITWQKGDDQPLPKKFGVEGCCTLKKNRTKQIDSGNYTCIAKNKAGTESNTVEIIVSGELTI